MTASLLLNAAAQAAPDQHSLAGNPPPPLAVMAVQGVDAGQRGQVFLDVDYRDDALHNGLLFGIEDAPPPWHDRPSMVGVGDLVEMFETQLAVPAMSSPEPSFGLLIPDPVHGTVDLPSSADLVSLVAPDPLPDDVIEHASDGVGLSFDDRVDLSALWNRLF